VLGVIFTAAVVFTGNPFPIGVVGDSFLIPSMWLGGGAFVAAVYMLYRWTEKLA